MANIENIMGKAHYATWEHPVMNGSCINRFALHLILPLALVVFQKAGLQKYTGRNHQVKPRLHPCGCRGSKQGGIAAFIDAEHALDPAYARKLGVNTDELYISQPDTGEQALDIADALVRSGAVDIIVIDSVAALVPKAEIDGNGR